MSQTKRIRKNADTLRPHQRRKDIQEKTEWASRHEKHYNIVYRVQETKAYDARYPGMVKVKYPFHPLYGRELSLKFQS